MTKRTRNHPDHDRASAPSEAQPARHENLVTVESQREFDLFSGEWADRVFVKLYVAARTSGLLAAMSDRDWKTLCTLATYMDSDGYCFPSQKELAAAMGCSRQMANERIRSLAKFRFEEQPVLLIVKGNRSKGGKWGRNGYRVLSLSNLRIYDEPGGKSAPPLSNDSGGDTDERGVGTVSSKLDTDAVSEETVSSSTVTVQLDTNKKQSSELEPDIPFEIRKRKSRKSELRGRGEHNVTNKGPEQVTEP